MPNIVTNAITNVNNFARFPPTSASTATIRITSNPITSGTPDTALLRAIARTMALKTVQVMAFPHGNPAKQGPDPNNRAHYAAILDDVWTLSPSTVLNARVSWDRYYWLRSLSSNDAFDGSVLGFKGPTGWNTAQHFPNFTFSNYTSIGGNVDRMFQPNDTFSLVTDLSHTAGRHFLKWGIRAGQARFSRTSTGDLDGLFAFTPAFTQRDPQRADNTSGNAIASSCWAIPIAAGPTPTPGPLTSTSLSVFTFKTISKSHAG